MRYAFLIFCLFFALPTQAQPKLQFPVLCNFGINCWVLYYMDVEGNPRKTRDFTCGARAGEADMFTRIAVKDLATAARGVPVVAAADGQVTYVQNNVIDKLYSPGQRVMPCGNAIVIEHAKGRETQYCHLRQGSIPHQPGDAVKQGQFLGVVGLSGATTWPHLGFAVLDYDLAIDPFSGRSIHEGCGLTPKPLWQNAALYTYKPFSIYNIGFSENAPSSTQLDFGFETQKDLPVSVKSLTFWAGAFGTQKGDRLEIRITNPDGEVLEEETITLSHTRPKTMFAITADRGNGFWFPGFYRGDIRLIRPNGIDDQVTAWTATIELKDDDKN